MSEKFVCDDCGCLIEPGTGIIRHSSWMHCVAALQARVADLEAVINAAATEMAVQTLKPVDGAANDFILKHPMFALFESAVTEAFVAAGAVNYLETKFGVQDKGNFIVTVQKIDGKTPHELRVEFEQKASTLETENFHLNEGMNIIKNDVAIAADELMVSIPEPGTDLFRVLVANGLLTARVSALEVDKRDLAEIIADRIAKEAKLYEENKFLIDAVKHADGYLRALRIELAQNPLVTSLECDIADLELKWIEVMKRVNHE